VKLSVRLTTLQSYFHDAHSVWDIGCDHGILGLSFVNRKTLKEIHLVDSSSLVIENLKKKNIDAYITKKDLSINIYEKKGQDIILNEERKIIYIAGMGGKEIKEILEKLLPQVSTEDRVVISPHRKILELREYLHLSKWRLMDEQVVSENDQFYQVLCLSTFDYSPVSLYGEQLWRVGEGPAYRKHQLETFRSHTDPRSCAYFAYLKG
jgi:tRNA (adenine22-N1)-methyltransferase